MKKDHKNLDRAASLFFVFHTFIEAGLARVLEWPSSIDRIIGVFSEFVVTTWRGNAFENIRKSTVRMRNT